MDIEPLYFGIVQPWDCDLMGHFTVRRFAPAFDDASYQFLFLVTGGRPVSADSGIGWADVRQVYEYLGELLPGDPFEIVARPLRLGTSSLTVEYEMRRRDIERRCATMTSTLVRFDLEARRSVAIEEPLRARIAALIAQAVPPSE
jgi:acyl-CoA thioester hydrolase